VHSITLSLLHPSFLAPPTHNQQDDYVQEKDYEDLEFLEKNITMDFQDSMMPVGDYRARDESDTADASDAGAGEAVDSSTTLPVPGDRVTAKDHAETELVGQVDKPSELLTSSPKRTRPTKTPNAKSKNSKFVAANPANLDSYHRDVVSRQGPRSRQGGQGQGQTQRQGHHSLSGSMELPDSGLESGQSLSDSSHSRTISTGIDSKDLVQQKPQRHALVPRSSRKAREMGKKGRKGWWLVLEERKFHISMTKWGLRCLRWLVRGSAECVCERTCGVYVCVCVWRCVHCFYVCVYVCVFV
jgi:hypothetical protein